MGLPFAEQGDGLGSGRDDLRQVDAVVERQLDQLDRDRSVQHQQRTRRSAAWPPRRLVFGAVLGVRHRRGLFQV